MRQPGFNEKTFWQGAMVLSIAAIITKILSAAYRIPYQNIAGDIGFYVYQQVYPFYGIAFILSIYGFPVVISKLMSETRTKAEMQQVISVSFYTLSVFCVCMMSFLFFFSYQIAQVMGDINLSLLLRITAFSFLMVPFLSVFRGYYQGKGMMQPTAISQVIEQFIRVSCILLFAVLLIRGGFGPYEIGAGAVFGSVIGAVAAIMVLFVYFLKSEIDFSFRPLTHFGDLKKIVRRLFIDSMLICFAALIFVMFQLVDALTIIRLLQATGMSEIMAKLTKGVYDRGQPLLQLGSFVSTSFSVSLVPMIAYQLSKNLAQKANGHAELAIRLSFIIGISASVGLAIVIEPTNAMLFTNRANSHVLAVIGMSILFSCIALTSSAVLQGYGRAGAPARNICIGIIVKLLLNLSFIPVFGIIGASFATFIGFFVISWLNIGLLFRIGALPTLNWDIYGAVIRAASVMAIITYCWLYFLELGQILPSNRLGEAILSLSSVMIGAAVYLLFLYQYRVLLETELQFIPKGKKMKRWLECFRKKYEEK